MDTFGLLVGVAIGLILGATITWGFLRTRKDHIESAVAEGLTDRFKAIASEALNQNSESFLQLADQNLQKHLNAGKVELDARKQAVEKLVEPLSSALTRMEGERKTSEGKLSQLMESITTGQGQLAQETRNLTQALRTPQVRGRWGEMVLKRVAELAGMVERCDFFEQQHLEGDGRSFRPDMVVQLPSNRRIAVDAKTPMDAYLRAVAAETDEVRKIALEDHARQVGDRVRELAKKSYWESLGYTPEFVVLFLPGEFLLGPALEHDENLMARAMTDRVIIATPFTLIALLLAVAYGWRETQLADNARRISQLGQELHDRLYTLAVHLTKMGKALSGTVDLFNKGIGTLEHRVVASAREFKKLGIGGDKEIPEIKPIDAAPRQVNEALFDSSTVEPKTRA